jgi:hypothetical protein
VYDRAVRWSLVLAIAIAAATARAAPAPAPAPAPAAADTVALLPLATGKGFALYGQPVAAELARAMRAAGLEVVVVSVGATPPARAKLVVDGTIESGPHGAVALEARVRDPAKGVVVANVSSSAPELGALDRAAADLSAQLVPAVKAKLAALDAPPPAPVEPVPPVPDVHDQHPIPPVKPVPALQPAAVVWGASQAREFPAAAAADLARELVAATGHRALDAARAPDGKPVGGDFELAIDVVAYTPAKDGVWTARASARVRLIAPDGRVVVSRVVHTDTVVAAKGEERDAMVHYAAAQLADILRPRVTAWAQGKP